MRRVSRRLALALAGLPTVAVVCVLLPSAGAEDAGVRWTGMAEASPLSPGVGVAGEIRSTIPLARSSIDSSPERCEAMAAVADISTGERPAGSEYGTPLTATARNPDAGPGTAAEVAPLGAGGPVAMAECRRRTEARSRVNDGVMVAGAVVVSQGLAAMAAEHDDAPSVTGEARSEVHDLSLGGVSIVDFASTVTVHTALGRDPEVTYRMVLAGVEVAGRSVVGVDGSGLSLIGDRVAPRDLFDQFNRQTARYGAILNDPGVAASIELVEPEVEMTPDGGVTVTAPVLRVRGRGDPVGLGVVGLDLGRALVSVLLATVIRAPGASVAPETLEPDPGLTPAPPASPAVNVPPAVTAGPHRPRTPAPTSEPTPRARASGLAAPTVLALGGRSSRAGGRTRGPSHAFGPPFPSVHARFLVAVSVAMALMSIRAALAARGSAGPRRLPG